MKPKLKEDPREWLKFTAVIALMLAVLAVTLQRRHVISGQMLLAILALLGIAMLVCWVRPRWFRGLYRGGMTLSFHVGRVMGAVLLTFFFLLVLTPLGLVLRLMGKDLLNLKRNPSSQSYWQPAKTGRHLDRQF